MWFSRWQGRRWPDTLRRGAVGKDYKGNWRPGSIRAPFLIFFMFLCIQFILVIEFLLQTSKKHGAIKFGDADGKLSVGSRFLFHYLAIIASVIFGLLWAIPEHDIKRMEPYFQLSKPEGATAENSLLLEYSYTFVLCLPYAGLKRRHWAIVFSSVITILTAFGVVPLMSGIFDQTPILRSIQFGVHRSNLYRNQNHTISAEFGYLAHNYAWLNGSLPPFTTPEFSALPFQINNQRGLGNNETWVGETIIFEADLRCRQAPITYRNNTYSVSNGKDCSYTFPKIIGIGSAFSYWQDWNTWFMGHGPNEKDDWYRDPDLYHLSSPLGNCSNQHTFLALWAGNVGTNPVDKWAATFCEPECWSQSANITVQMPEGVITDVQRLGKKIAFDNFNITQFEEFVVNGRKYATPQGAQSFGILPSLFPYPIFQLFQQFGYFDFSKSSVAVLNKRSISNFVLANQTKATLDDLFDPTLLAKAYGDAYKLLFAVCVTSELIDRILSSRATITRNIHTQGFLANPTWCRISQGGFGLLALLTAFLLISTWGRRCNLDGEPNSIAALMKTVSRNRAFSGDMDNSEYKNLGDLYERLTQRKHRYHLRFTPDGSGPQLDVTKEADGVVLLDSSEFTPDPTDSVVEMGLTHVLSKNHWSLSRCTGFLQLLAFIGLLGLLIYLYVYDRSHSGLPVVFQNNSLRYKALFSYIPTTLGTGIESLWVVIGGHMCMVWPYQTLHRGQAPASKSLTVDFDKTPPHFQLYSPFSHGGAVISVIAIATLLANLLTVAFGGLFSPGTAMATFEADITRYQQPTILAGMVIIDGRNPWNIFYQNDMYYLLLGYVSGYITLPTWTTEEFYIFPFNNTMPNNKAVSRQGKSWGFGASISCELIPEGQLSSRTIQPGNYSLDIRHPCSPNTTFTWLNASLPSTDFLLRGSCPESVFGVWVQPSVDPKASNTTNAYLNQAEYVALACNSSLTITELLVSADRSGNILKHEVANPKVPPIVEPPSPTTFMAVDPNLVRLFEKFVNSPAIPRMGQVDDDAHPFSWINTLMTRVRPDIGRDSATLNNLPDIAHLEQTFEYVYISIFAIFIGLYSDLILRYNVSETSRGTENMIQDRVDVSTPMFGIAVSVLAFFIAAALYVHSVRPARPLHHRPTTLAATHTLLYASNALEDISALQGKNTKERGEKLEQLGHRY